MRRMWLGMAWLASVAAGCGAGRAIFDVDVYSFLKGTGQDTVPYFIPPNTPNLVVGSVPQRISLPGAGSSVVDSVGVFATVNLVNRTGTGTVGLQLFLAADSAGTYSPGAAALTVRPRTVTPNTTVADTVAGALLSSADSLFRRAELWARVAAQGSNADLVTPVQGTLVLTSLRLTVVISDKIF
jgi:hypothetical protein